MSLFRPEDRTRLDARVRAWAEEDVRIVAGARLGSLALGPGDRWSDLDLSFAVRAGTSIDEVLDDWTGRLAGEFDAIRLFDVPWDSTVYRVFLLPGCLQFDLSLTPADEFGARGPKFRLLFGEAVDRPHAKPPDPAVAFGHATHHALRARFSLERGRFFQSEYWLSATRDLALSLACRRRGLAADHARGFDDLPADVREAFGDAVPRSLEPAELARALTATIDGLIREAEEVREFATSVEPRLRALCEPADGR